MSASKQPQVLDHGVLRLLTAGSVDDGKSTLIGRLLYDTRAILSDQLAAIERTSQRRGSALDLSLLTDGLVAEREQGITIDVAYRYFATARRKFIIADAPGHAQYTRNMVTAASTSQLAILLIDARHGVITQTRRHATLAHMLGVEHLVVAVNKMDLVGFSADVFSRIVDDFLDFAARSGIDNARFVPMSALEGDMIVDRGGSMPWYEGPTLLEILESVDVSHALADAPFRFPVQYVSRPGDGKRRGYMGRIESGMIAAGDAVVVFPSGQKTRVRAIRTFAGGRSSAELHAAVSLELDDDIDIARGDMLVAGGELPPPARELSADICWLSQTPLDVHGRFVLRHTTRELQARVDRIDHLWNVETQQREPAPGTLAMNAIGRISVALAEPLFADRYADNTATGSFILVDPVTNNTVAAGMVR
ncbi:MAG: GTP-binding protein [Betaproteobacteria bacterium]